MINVCIVLGTRPERIKFAPLIKLLSGKNNVNLTVIDTNQHKDLGKDVYDTFDIKPTHQCDGPNVVQNNTNVNQLSTLFNYCYSTIESNVLSMKTPPDVILVQGDTTTALAGAMVAFHNKIKLGHLESGLRTGDMERPYPEEGNRILIDSLSHYMFAPTLDAYSNTHKKYFGKTYLTGNTIVDAVKHIQKNTKRNEFWTKKYVLITMHRRETQGCLMTQIFNEIHHLALENPEIDFVLIKHKNPNVLKSLEDSEISKNQVVKYIEPEGYESFIHKLSCCEFVITDSGGIQEECVTLKKKCFVMRESTERAEGIDTKYIELCPPYYCDYDPDGMYDAMNPIKTFMQNNMTISFPMKENPFGDGLACQKIYDILTRGQ